MKKGYFLLTLHAHLPFVRHPEHRDFLEERWLFEAITDTYVPLIDLFDRLQAEAVPFQVTMSVTPTLASMLKDPLLKERYLCHLSKLIELAEKEKDRTRNNPQFHPLAELYHQRFLRVRTIFQNRYGGNLIRAFRKFREAGNLEMITCAATHGYLPKFPLKQIEEMSLATRKIGLGVMGLGDLLYELRLPYNTDEGRKFMEKLMQFIAYY